MSIHAISGVPGAGKTSLAMEILAAKIQENQDAVKAGKPALVVKHRNGKIEAHAKRPLYVSNVDGIVESEEYTVLPDPTVWNKIADGDTCDCLNGTHQVLVKEGFRPDGSEAEAERFREELGKRRWHGHVIPDGSWLLVDEAWAQFGHVNDARGRPPPMHVQALAEHRHRSIDFLWTFQGPAQIYPSVRNLISPHWHSVARFGPFIDVYKWGEFVEDIKSQGMRDRAQKQPRTLPTKVRSMWQSATAHTGRPKFPKKMIWAAVAVLAAIPLLWFAVTSFTPTAMAERASGKAPEAGLPADGASGKRPGHADRTEDRAPMTAAEWGRRFEPRIAGVHGSQPVFDERQVAAVPRTFCMISGTGRGSRCRCFTEQATPIDGVEPAVCRTWASEGQYDPFLAPAASHAASSAPAVAPGATVTPHASEDQLRLAAHGFPALESTERPSVRPRPTGVISDTLRPWPSAPDAP